jgi:transcriptional regulator with XRE-family HTH domain
VQRKRILLMTVLSFGDKLKKIRIERNMSQEELGEFLGTSKQVISRYETNQRVPKITVVEEYAKKLNVPLNYLINNSISNVDDAMQTENSFVSNLGNGMTVGSRIQELRQKLGLTQDQIAEQLNMNRANFSNYERDVAVPPGETLAKIADILRTSTDYLLGRNDIKLSSKEEHDIARDLEKILSNLENEDSLAFYGEPLDDETKELMRISLENSMRLAKQIAKKKFTPNKYK